MKKMGSIILAAGDGKRMKSSLPKMLHRAAGKPLVEWVVEAAEQALGVKPIVVYGAGGSAVPDYLGERCVYALQAERKGSGHAVMMARELMAEYDYVTVIAGDMPLVEPSSIHRLAELAEQGEYAALLLTGKVVNPAGYGRILRDGAGRVTGIVEDKDATPEQKEIDEINLSFYCFQTRALAEALDEITPANAQGEYYLTDVIGIMHQKGLPTGALVIDDPSQCEGVNNRAQLAQAAERLRERINTRHMMNGVTMLDPRATYVDDGVTIGADTVIYPGVILEGNTVVGEGCTLYQGSRIADSVIEDGATIQNSVITESHVGKGTQVGPYAYLRPGSNIGAGCRIGDFVEVKNSNIDDGAKVSHLTYVGDGDVGKNVNVGCGVVFVNYDGKEKARTTVGDDAFIGCNTNLISPVSVGKGAYIAAGATVTKDIPDDALCIARAREIIKDGWGRGRYQVKKK